MFFFSERVKNKVVVSTKPYFFFVRVQRLYFLSLFCFILEGGCALQEDAAGSVARDPAASHASEEAAGAAEAGAALVAGAAAPPSAAATAVALLALLALASSRHRMFYPLEKKTNGMLLGRRFL